MVKADFIDHIFQASPVPTSILKPDAPDYTISLVNNACLELIGRKASELLGQSFFSAFPSNPEEVKPHGSTRLLESLDRVVREKRPDELPSIRYDIVIGGEHYSEKYWKIVNTPLIGENGEVEFIINTVSEITEWVMSERENALMINHTEDSFILIDLDLKVLNFNDLFARNYRELFNVKVKKGDSILKYASPDRQKMVKGIYERVFNGEIVESELSVGSAQGKTRYFLLRYKPARDENGTIIGSFVSVLEVTDRVNYEKELQKSLAEKETLLAEIHHRVKNNLAVVSGMMQLQAFEADHQELRDQLLDSAGRIKTMATVHELLYQAGSFSRLEFSDTVKSLAESIAQTLKTDTVVDIDFQCEPIQLTINQAIPASLIANEVITNVYKHAFRNQNRGEMSIRLKEADNLVKLVISDNGSGLPENVLDVSRKSSLGFHLIDLLSKQIHALYDYRNGSEGTLFELMFRKIEYKSEIGSSRVY